MKACTYFMPEACSETSSRVETVQVEVSAMHPLLLLKQALPWEAITETMTRHWRECGKNVDGGPGLPWDVSLYVPLLVLMLIPRPRFAIIPTSPEPMWHWDRRASRTSTG